MLVAFYCSLSIICSPNFEQLSEENPSENNRLAFSVAEKHLGISSLIKPEEMVHPDRLAFVTYISLFYELFYNSQPATLPTGAECDSKIKKSTTSKSSVEKSEKSPIKLVTSEVSTFAKSPVSVEKASTSYLKSSSSKKWVNSSEKLKSLEESTTTSQNSFTFSKKQVSSVEKPEAVEQSSTSSPKSAIIPGEQGRLESSQHTPTSSQIPFTTPKKKVTTGEKVESKQASTSSQRSFTSSTKKASSSEKFLSLEKSTSSSKKPFSPTEKQVTSVGKSAAVNKLGTSDEKLVEKQVTLAEKCATSVQDEPIITPSKKKKRFRLFSRRKKKKSLATAIPSIER